MTCVSDTPDVERVLFGADGIAAGARPGHPRHRLLDDLAVGQRGFGERLAEQGIAIVDAPVSGGSEGAQKGTLTIFVGGDAADVERARPVLAGMGKTITHLGPLGSGQAAKAVNQVILAGAYLGVAEGIVLAIKAGLDPEQLVAALAGGAARTWVLENRSGRMIANDYPLGFKVSLHRKDLGIALELAKESGAALPVAPSCAQLETGLSPRATATRTCRRRAHDPRAVGPRELSGSARGRGRRPARPRVAATDAAASARPSRPS